MEDYIDVTEFDLSDPEFLASLEEYVPDINMDAAPEAPIVPAPPSDGIYQIKVRPNRRRKGEAIYYKDLKKNARTGKIASGKVIAALVARTFDAEANKEETFLKDYYATSVAFGADKGSSLTFICKQAGSKITDRAPITEIKRAAEEVFALNEEDGIILWARLRWTKSVPRIVEIAEGVWGYEFDANDQKIYDETKGEAKIKALAVMESQQEIERWVQDEEETLEEFEARKAHYVETAPLRAHLFWDPVVEKELRVMAEIAELLDPKKLPVR
jgi:hypothetical protein